MLTTLFCTPASSQAERWLGLLSDLGRSPATIDAYRGALTHFFHFCCQRELPPSRQALKISLRTFAPSYPACLSLQPVQRFSFAFLLYVCGLTI